MTIVEDPPSAATPPAPAPTAVATVPTSLARYWLLVVLLVLVFAGAALAYAWSLPQTYTSEARLTVGQYDASSPGGLAGFADASQALASSYSLTVRSEAVLRPVARKVGLPFQVVFSRVSASPVPQSPVIRVTARGPSERSAITLANTSADSLVSYVDRLSNQTGRADQLLTEVRRAIGRRNEFSSDLRAARERFGEDNSPLNQRRVERAETRVDVEDLRVDSLRQSYRQSVVAPSSASLVEVLSRSQTAASDRASTLQLYGFAGFALGALLGAALATLRLNRVRRKAARVDPRSQAA